MELYDMDLKSVLKYMKTISILVRTGAKVRTKQPIVLFAFLVQVSTFVHDYN
jgi:hypothetical protein